jgi:hypothetical protein
MISTQRRMLTTMLKAIARRNARKLYTLCSSRDQVGIVELVPHFVIEFEQPERVLLSAWFHRQSSGTIDFDDSNIGYCSSADVHVFRAHI